MENTVLELEVGQKAIAKEGMHQFESGTEISFIGTVAYGEFFAYDFVGFIGDSEISQHLSEHEFELIEE